MTTSFDLARCLGTADEECTHCARRTTREQAREQAERTGVDRSWWIAPPTARPCGQRVELERA